MPYLEGRSRQISLCLPGLRQPELHSETLVQKREKKKQKLQTTNKTLFSAV